MDDENSPVVLTLIRDGSVGIGGNLCKKRYYLSMVGPLGKACKKCVTDQKQKNIEKLPGVSEWRGLASVGTAGNCSQIDIGCRRLQGWDHLTTHARIVSRGEVLSGVSEWQGLTRSNRVYS